MATKTRLNMKMRAHLRKLAAERVHDTETKAALTVATKAFHKMILRHIKEVFPPKDMQVLAKYDLAKPGTDWALLIVRDAKNGTVAHDHWRVPVDMHETMPLRPHSPYGQKRLRIEAKNDLDVWDAYASADAAHEKARNEKLGVFLQLINNASNLEQIIEVWPAAREVRPNLPTVPLAPLMDQVRAIVEAKQA